MDTPSIFSRHLGGQAVTLLTAVAVAALSFQVVHAIEHVAQVAYWFVHPDAMPWLTPWATAGRDVLAATTDGHATSGSELLHLAGNVVFLAGLAALVTVVSHRSMPVPRPMCTAIWIQGLHVLEHVALTATWFTFGRALGVTTLFGTVHGTAGTSLRVWAHLALKLVATTYMLQGLRQLVRDRPRPHRTTDAPDRRIPTPAGHPEELGSSYRREPSMRPRQLDPTSGDGRRGRAANGGPARSRSTARTLS